MITPTSPNVQDALQAAVDAGITVILVDNDIPDWDGKTSLVATDNHAGGVLAGQFMAEQLKRRRHDRVLEGVAGAPSLQAARRRLQEGLGDGFDIVASLPTDCDQTKGLDAAQDILTANPDVTAIYGACGPPIIGALQAVADAGSSRSSSASTPGRTSWRRSPPAPSWGRSPSSPTRWDRLGPQAALDAINGVAVEPNIDTGTAMVTADNVADFMAPAGSVPATTA